MVSYIFSLLWCHFRIPSLSLSSHLSPRIISVFLSLPLALTSDSKITGYCIYWPFCIRCPVLHYVFRCMMFSLQPYVSTGRVIPGKVGLGRSNNKCPLSLHGRWQNVFHGSTETHLSIYSKNISILYWTWV